MQAPNQPKARNIAIQQQKKGGTTATTSKMHYGPHHEKQRHKE